MFSIEDFRYRLFESQNSPIGGSWAPGESYGKLLNCSPLNGNNSFQIWTLMFCQGKGPMKCLKIISVCDFVKVALCSQEGC